MALPSSSTGGNRATVSWLRDRAQQQLVNVGAPRNEALGLGDCQQLHT